MLRQLRISEQEARPVDDNLEQPYGLLHLLLLALLLPFRFRHREPDKIKVAGVGRMLDLSRCFPLPILQSSSFVRCVKAGAGYHVCSLQQLALPFGQPEVVSATRIGSVHCAPFPFCGPIGTENFLVGLGAYAGDHHGQSSSWSSLWQQRWPLLHSGAAGVGLSP